jgi:GNAT superfamily N-acetyltransferase
MITPTAPPTEEPHVIRTATADDLPGVRAVAHEHHVLDSWPAQPDFLDLELTHGRLAVAEVDGAVAGFGGTVPRGALTYLGDLFVTAAAQSRGLGRGLIEHLLAGTGDLVTFASSDARAWARYLAAGMVPRYPLVYLRGRLGERPQAPAGPDHGDLGRVVALDAAASGGRRPAVLRWFAGQPGVDLHTVGDSYAFTRTVNGKVIIGPAGGEPAVLAALAAAGDRDLQLTLPGPHPLVPRLVRAGLRISDRVTIMSSTPVFDPEHYVPNVSIG